MKKDRRGRERSPLMSRMMAMAVDEVLRIPADEIRLQRNVWARATYIKNNYGMTFFSRRQPDRSVVVVRTA